jgi:hypothetical protein
MAKKSSTEGADEAVPTYLIYDARTGAILQRHRSSSAETEAYKECDEKALLKEVQDDEDLLDLVESKKDIAVIRADMPERPGAARGFRVDPKKRTLVARERIVLTPDKTEIEGDGSDRVQIALHIEDSDGNRTTTFNGDIKVTTTRGKLSARKGIVEVGKGRAEFTLTSVAETADDVTVRAASMDGTLSPAEIRVSFV